MAELRLRCGIRAQILSATSPGISSRKSTMIGGMEVSSLVRCYSRWRRQLNTRSVDKKKRREVLEESRDELATCTKATYIELGQLIS